MALFKTADGRDLVAVNACYKAITNHYIAATGEMPEFYIFENNTFVAGKAMLEGFVPALFFENTMIAKLKILQPTSPFLNRD